MTETLSEGASTRTPETLRPPFFQRWDGFHVLYDLLKPRDFAEHQHPPLQVIVPFRHASLRMIWQTAGGRGETRLLKEGDVSIISSKQPHAISWEREAEWAMFWLTPEFIERAVDGLFPRGSVEIAGLPAARDSFIAQLGRALRTEVLQSSALPRIYAESLANVLAVHLVRHYSVVRPPAPRLRRGGLTARRLRRATDYINEHLERDLTLSEIAETVGLSAYHFARQLKRETGLSPHQYLIERRMERAKELLAATNLPVVEICQMVGFHSQSYFTSLFRRRTGMTPKAFRESF